MGSNPLRRNEVRHGPHRRIRGRSLAINNLGVSEEIFGVDHIMSILLYWNTMVIYRDH